MTNQKAIERLGELAEEMRLSQRYASTVLRAVQMSLAEPDTSEELARAVFAFVMSYDEAQLAWREIAEEN